MDHDIYKPLFLIRLSDLDPERHVLVVECQWCGLKREIDVARYMAEHGDHLIRWFGSMIPCPTCDKRPGTYFVEMRPGVAPRPLKEVDPHR
jgi:sarcosine oxidase delta subunit